MLTKLLNLYSEQSSRFLTSNLKFQMPLFQQSVLNKKLNTLDGEVLLAKWEVFKAHFQNPIIQQNIRNSKEEQYQEGFLRDLFVNVLGYTLNPSEGFNLTTEYKNIKDSKKADGAIIISGKVKAVIELKGNDTTDLDKIEPQAFGYKNNQPDCKYIIISNFEKLRFYIENTIDYIEFNLFNLTFQEFKVLWICLKLENIVADLPQTIKNASVNQEEIITKELYKDYSSFKRELFKNIVELNPDHDELELFKKTQKLIDRFLFILFAEDRGLLPVNSTRLILSQWEKLIELDEEIPLYDRYKKYFGYLNTGHVGKKSEIFAYNGGLFRPDAVLDNLLIDDNILYEHTKKLSAYDYGSEVDVNILGHIFENSLNEIDEIKAQIEGKEIEKSQTKRKKDGVFYTPKYITKYIVENTVGRLCEEKKRELSIEDTEFAGTKAKQKEARQALLQRINTYREWLLQITIVDPACGSGAFLNEALNFLIDEHNYLDELETKVTGGAIVFHNIESSILENNLFGVDINEESVEIAKLSLWLRTAKPRRKLNDLSNSIKCGNSLIDDPEVAGDKAFNWQKEFPHVFAKGGFDVVIGNPPYLNMTKNNTNEDWLKYYIEKYKSVKKANSKNLYTLFNEVGAVILKNKGMLSFIIPEGFLKTRSYEDCVDALNELGKITKAVYFEDWVFEDATTGSVIFEFVKNTNCKIEFSEWFFTRNKELIPIYNKVNSMIERYDNLNFPKLSEVAETFKGMAVKDRKNFIFDEINSENKDVFMLGNCIDRYLIKNKFYTDYDKLIIVGGTKKKEKYLKTPRILIRRTGDFLCCVLLDHVAYTESTLYSTSINSEIINIKYLLAILNSKLLTYVVRQKMITNQQAFPQILMTDLELLKIPIVENNAQQPFIDKADQMLSLNKDLQDVLGKLHRNLKREFALEKLSTKLQNWNECSYEEFLKELAKAKVSLTLSQKAELDDYFTAEQKKVQEIKLQIETTDREIDRMVYELYELTDEEVRIVEGE